MPTDTSWDYEDADVRCYRAKDHYTGAARLILQGGAVHPEDSWPAELDKTDVAALAAHLQHVLATWPDEDKQ